MATMIGQWISRLWVGIVGAATAALCVAGSVAWAAAGVPAEGIQVEVHSLVEPSERFNLVFVVETDRDTPKDFSWAGSDDFQVVWGPQKGSSTSVQIVNGKTSRSARTSYTYILQPRRVGSFTLPAATATLRGKAIVSRPVTVQVVADGGGGSAGNAASGSAAGAPRGAAPAQGSSAKASGPDIFLRLALSRNHVVVGEPVTVTAKIYHRAHLAGFDQVHFPAFKGFWSQEVDSPDNIDFHREQVDGKMYNAALLRRWVIIPQKAGEFAVDPAEVVCLVNVDRPRSGRSIFDDFFADDYVTTRERVVSSAATLRVDPLPSNAPVGFDGAVGRFSIKARLSKDSLRAHDAASLFVTVSGQGNIALVNPPKVRFPADFETYDVRTTVKMDKTGTSGSKTFEYPFIPRSAGDFSIGAIPYACFDLASRRYQSLSTDSLALHVARQGVAVGDGAGGDFPAASRDEVRTLGRDIRYVHALGGDALWQGERFFVGSAGYWLCLFALLALGTAVWFSLRRRAARLADIPALRNRRALKQARRKLAQVRRHLHDGDKAAFYTLLYQTLLDFAGDKLSLDPGALLHDTMREGFLSAGVDAQVADAFLSLLDACEFARYAPSSGGASPEAHCEAAQEVIAQIESAMSSHRGAAPRVACLALCACLSLGLGAAMHTAGAAVPPGVDSLLQAGLGAYAQGDFAAAEAHWKQVHALGYRSADLCYNLGNACYRTHQVGEAVLWYERALRLDPSHEDASYNLGLVSQQLQDRIEEIPVFFLEAWARSCCFGLSSDAWAGLSLFLLALFVGFGVLFLRASRVGLRKTGFFSALLALVLALLCVDFAFWQRRECLRTDRAVVLRSVSSAKSAPSGDEAKNLFLLHEGTRVRVLERVRGFVRIALADGRQGWMPEGDLETI